jgi:phospholipase/carboxylesterase
MDRSNNMPGQQQKYPVFIAGEPLERAKAAMIMIHGRGATAEDILNLKDEIGLPGFAYLAPQAAGYSWYPHSFLAPIADNEPSLSFGLATIASLFTQVETAGLGPERIMLLGFSQGACLALEFVARNAKRYGGVVGLSGGLIGPDDTPRNYPGSLEGTPVFLGCSERDFHIPRKRVELSAEVLRRMGGKVTARLYPNLGHTVNQDELQFVQRMMEELLEKEQ